MDLQARGFKKFLEGAFIDKFSLFLLDEEIII